LNGLKVKFNFPGERNVFGRSRQGTGRSFVHLPTCQQCELCSKFVSG
jgi:hypothetical protein